MNYQKLNNVSVSLFRKFLKSQGLEIRKGTRGRGGHECWQRKGLDRPITIQTTIDPIPEHIIKNSLRTLNISRNEFGLLLRKL